MHNAQSHAELIVNWLGGGGWDFCGLNGVAGRRIGQFGAPVVT